MKLIRYLSIISCLFTYSFLFAVITPNGRAVTTAPGHSNLSETDISAINYVVSNYYYVTVIQ